MPSKSLTRTRVGFRKVLGRGLEGKCNWGIRKGRCHLCSGVTDLVIGGGLGPGVDGEKGHRRQILMRDGAMVLEKQMLGNDREEGDRCPGVIDLAIRCSGTGG
jgi:hypothetical protein